MRSERLLGPPLSFVVISGLTLAAVRAGLWVEVGTVSVAFAALAALVAWRLLGVSVSCEGSAIVVRNILNTFRLPANEIDIRARVVDPRREQYSVGATDGYPEIPTTADDNTVNAAKWYLLEYGSARYQIDALMGRSPANHERLAFELRRRLLDIRDIAPGSDP